MPAIAFTAPHTNVSGGIKTICTLAQLASVDYKTSVIFNQLQDPSLGWLGGRASFNFARLQRGNITAYRDAACLIEFMDNAIDLNINIPRILYMQGFTFTHKEHANLKFQYKAVIATSKWLADLAVSYGHKQVVIIPPGIQDIFLHFGEKINKGNLIIGSLYHRFALKNSNAFIGAMENLAKEKKLPLKLILLSATPSEKNPSLPCEWYVAPKQVMLPDIYRRCDMWVSPSLREGFGLTTVEAMACGVPTIWVRSGGLDAYMMHEENCLIVEQRDFLGMQRAVVRLLEDTRLAEKLGSNGQKMARQFTWDNCYQKFKEVINKVLNGE